MFEPALTLQAKTLLTACRQKSLTLATAESCTGGLISALFTEIPGSSAVFDRGFVTYSNASKTQLLGVDAKLIEKHGAVSREVAAAMAKGAKERAKTNLAVAVTGIAGPDGGTKEKPVGLVFIAVAAGETLTVEECRFGGNRRAIRDSSVAQAISMLEKSLSSFVSVA